MVSRVFVSLCTFAVVVALLQFGQGEEPTMRGENYTNIVYLSNHKVWLSVTHGAEF